VTGAPDGPPVKVGVPITDLGAGLFAVFGILCALRARHRTGRGQLVDTSLYEAGVALSAWEATEWWLTGQVPQRLGTAHRMNGPYQALRARDGHFTVGANTERLWQRLAALVGRPDLVDDPRFKDNAGRVRHRAELQALIEAVTVGETRAHWLERCEAAGIPAGPIYSVPEALADPHVRARGMVQELRHPEAGSVQGLGNPVKLSRTPARLRKTAPRLGEDTRAVLGEAGYAADEIAALEARGIVRS
jgi:formyl-CoA transferase